MFVARFKMEAVHKTEYKNCFVLKYRRAGTIADLHFQNYFPDFHFNDINVVNVFVEQISMDEVHQN